MSRMVFLSKLIALSLFLSIGFGSCEKDDDYFKRPAWLGDPIYEQLESMGDFKHYLACVDKSGWGPTLKGTGYFTVFAPNDAAFEEFFAETGIGSIDNMSMEMTTGIVSYSLADVPASKDTIDDYLGSSTAELVYDAAYKRQTYYSRGVYEDYVWERRGSEWIKELKSLSDANGGIGDMPGSGWVYSENWHNRKHIPFFTDKFREKVGINEDDYNYLFPHSEFSDFNVGPAKVVLKNLRAENGIIHVVDKVITPLNNLDQMLAKQEETSMFKEIIDKYLTEYIEAPNWLKLNYEQATGVVKDILVKGNANLVFSLGNENFLRNSGATGAEEMDAYRNNFTLFAPTNEAVTNFFETRFFNYGYKNLDEMPYFVLAEFVNAHLFRTAVWPTRFSVTQNYFGEPARFDAGSAPGEANVLKAEMGSNGIFYIVDKVQATNAFETVLGDLLLNPKYTLMYQAMNSVAPEIEGLLKNPNNNIILFLISNEQFTQAGFQYNVASGAWEFTNSSTRPNLGNNVGEALLRFVNLHLILVNRAMIEKGFDIVNSSGVVKTYGEEYIKFGNGQVYASGNPTSARPQINLTVESGANNGQSYGLTSPMLFSVGNIGSLMRVSSFANVNNRASKLIAYLEKAANATYVNDDGVTTPVSGVAYNTANQSIKDITNSELITMFLPNDPAIDAAVSDGVLLPISSFAPNGDPNVIGNHNQIIERFTKYHIIRGTIPVGENAGGNYSTYLKKEDGTFATITVNAIEGTPGSLTVTDWKGRVANVNVSATTTFNILGNRCIVHLIDNYLDFRIPAE